MHYSSIDHIRFRSYMREYIKPNTPEEVNEDVLTAAFEYAVLETDLDIDDSMMYDEEYLAWLDKVYGGEVC